MLYKNRQHVFCLSSNEVFKITNQNTIHALFDLFTYSGLFFLESDIPIHDDSLYTYHELREIRFILETLHAICILFLDKLNFIMTYFKWRIFGCRSCKTPQLHNCFIRKMLKSQSVKVNSQQWWSTCKPWVDKNQLKYDTHVLISCIKQMTCSKKSIHSNIMSF
jgi:hypothetical protein